MSIVKLYGPLRHLVQTLHGSGHAKTCLRAYADSDGSAQSDQCLRCPLTQGWVGGWGGVEGKNLRHKKQ